MWSAMDSRIGRSLALAVALSLLVVACGSDDGGEVRDLDSDGNSATGSASASGSGSGSGSGSASGTADAECNPVNLDLAAEADAVVEIQAIDYAFVPPSIEVDAGVTTFEVENAGEAAHELAFLPGGGDVPLTEDGQPDEEALAEAGAFELEAFGAGQTCEATYDLDPGEYTIFCIVETEDGTTHHELGMMGTLTVNG